MHVALMVLAAWCTLSVLFAAAHCRWLRYAVVVHAPTAPGTTRGSFALDRGEMAPAGADASRFFGSYARP
jgi:hypothetical protein